jgi:predicted nucleotidyltransferase
MIDEQTLMETNWREMIADYDVPQTIILASHLGVDMDEAQHYIDDQDYLVLTDEEADKAVREEIEEMVWAFTPSFLSAHTNVSEEAIRKIQEMYEDANDALTEKGLR